MPRFCENFPHPGMCWRFRAWYTSCMGNRIIHSLPQRRVVEEAVAGLADTDSEAAMAHEVERIVREYAAELVLLAVRKHLGTGSSQMRGGLGRLAALLGGAETAAMLRKEAGRRDNSTQTRLNAAMILEKFLGIEVSAGLMGDLRDPNLVVMQSLQDAVTEARSNRHVLLEYVRQMRLENQDIAYLVLDLIGQLSEADRPELLRLIAYDSRGGVAEAALDNLGALRGSEVGRQSAWALHTLQSTLGPELAQKAARNLRKLRMAGVRWEPEKTVDDWWALLSPSDMQGTQHLWFLSDGDEDGCRLVGLRINRAAGVFGAFGGEGVDRRQLPARRQVGERLSISVSPGERSIFVAVPYSYARHCLQESLEGQWQGSGRPLPEEFTLYCPFVFECEREPVSDAISSLPALGRALWEEKREELAKFSAALLEHPAMAGWVLPVGNADADTGEIRRQLAARRGDRTGLQSLAGLPLEALGKLAASIVPEEVPQELGGQLRQALLAQGAWLHFAGDQIFAHYAAMVAESLLSVPLHGHPLLLQMVALGFLQPLGEGRAQ